MKPVPKGRPKFSRFGTYTPAKTLNAEKFIKKTIAQTFTGPLKDCPIILIVDFIFAPNKSDSKKIRQLKESGSMYHIKKPDLDNLVKLVKDALNESVIVDDAQIVAIYSQKLYGKEDKIIIGLLDAI